MSRQMSLLPEQRGVLSAHRFRRRDIVPVKSFDEGRIRRWPAGTPVDPSTGAGGGRFAPKEAEDAAVNGGDDAQRLIEKYLTIRDKMLERVAEHRKDGRFSLADEIELLDGSIMTGDIEVIAANYHLVTRAVAIARRDAPGLFDTVDAKPSIQFDADQDWALPKIEFPDEKALAAGRWKYLGKGPTSWGFWKVTTQDGKEWFVKRMRSDERWRNQAQVEDVATMIGEALGLPVVPTKRLTDLETLGIDSRATDAQREAGADDVSVHPWVEGHAADEFRATKVADKIDNPDLVARAALYDYIIGNVDRHKGNWMVANAPESAAERDKMVMETGIPAKDVRLIDHGFAFQGQHWPTTDFLRGDHFRSSISREHAQWLRQGVEKVFRQLDARSPIYVNQIVHKLDMLDAWMDEFGFGRNKVIAFSKLSTLRELNR